MIPLQASPTAGPAVLAFAVALGVLPPEAFGQEDPASAAMMNARRAVGKRRVALVEQGPPEAGKVFRQRDFLLIVPEELAEARALAGIVDHARSLRKWLEATLGGLGAEPPGRFLLRVVGSDAEAARFREVAEQPFAWPSREVVIALSGGELGPQASADLGCGLFAQYLAARHPALLAVAPPWIALGVEQLGRSSVYANGALLFETPPAHWQRCADLQRVGRMPSLEALFRGNASEGAVEADPEGDRAVAAVLLRYLLVDGGRDNGGKALLLRALSQIATLLDGADHRIWIASEGAAQTDADLRLDAFEAFQESRRRAWADPGARAGAFHESLAALNAELMDPVGWKRLQRAFETYVANGLR